MLDWVKIESKFLYDSRIKNLIEQLRIEGLGIYLTLRIAIDSYDKDGMPLRQVINACPSKASRKKIIRVLDEFGLFRISELETVTALPLVSELSHVRADACADTSADTCADTSAETSAELGASARDLLGKKKKEEKKPSFQKPTLEEVTSYCQERQNNIDPEAFIDFYESKGWLVGTSPMKDWQSAIRTWERKRKEELQNTSKNCRDAQPCVSQQGSMSDPSQYNTYEKPTTVNCQQIPPDAPPKPSPNAQWDFATDSWNEFY